MIQHTSAYLPHKWIIKVLQAYKAPEEFIDVIQKPLRKWAVIMTAIGKNKQVETEEIEIKCNVFKGDSLSPFVFCIRLDLCYHKYWKKNKKKVTNSRIRKRELATYFTCTTSSCTEA